MGSIVYDGQSNIVLSRGAVDDKALLMVMSVDGPRVILLHPQDKHGHPIASAYGVFCEKGKEDDQQAANNFNLYVGQNDGVVSVFTLENGN